MVSRYGLPWWFAIESVLGIAVAMQDRRYLFFDARLYLEATRVWLAGGDPWNVQIAGNYFAAPPPTCSPSRRSRSCPPTRRSR